MVPENTRRSRPASDAAARLRRRRRLGAGAVLWAVALGAQAQSVTFNGMLGDRALMIIDGEAQTLAVGGSAKGVRLLRLDGSLAQIEIGGKAQSLRLGGSATGSAPQTGPNGTRITLPVGLGGHFTGVGSINGHAVQFVVDTGATAVSMGSDEAARLGLDVAGSSLTNMMTANGVVTARVLTLTTVRVGEVSVNDVRAVVMPQPMPYVLLGNSFLSRFQMRTDSGMMVLDKKP